jgi:hypothetical protein
MRLLICSETGKFSFTKDLVGDDLIPPYAILSHLWGPDNEEVTFEDITNGTGEKKLGYEKIRFCGEQARQDGLDYFWVDTCCIDKENKAEFAQAINSMFRWYRNAAQCYVYLSDVSCPHVGLDLNDEYNLRPWESDFRKSKWFTRGWTLQELLAPVSVEFFSQERKRLGDKSSLRQQIHEITNISQPALQGAHLSQFSVEERLRWIEHRQTKLEEDKAYSLLGIFGVYILPTYGEGIARALNRILDEFREVQKCIRDLHLTDPSNDKKRIEDTKGGLLEDLYHWILENPQFQQWRDDQQSRLLWIKGDPGKGKTMLLCGIINELKNSIAKSSLLSYFFCQATDSRINNATAVLRGLIYLLVGQQPSLISHLRKKYDDVGKSLFEDTNAWVALSDIFKDILQDPNLEMTYLVIDALDECVTDLPKLLDFIVYTSSSSARVKWLLSSRNELHIEQKLRSTDEKARLSLELRENAEQVSRAVDMYIDDKLSRMKSLQDNSLRDQVRDILRQKANGTFLWVALVCQNLETIPRWKILRKLNSFPPGLDSLYGRMMKQLCKLEDAEFCKQILALIAIVYRPITPEELMSVIAMPGDMSDDLEALGEIIGLCGSFLTIREGTIYLVHQSAKDFFFKEAFNEIFPSGKGEAHYQIFSRSLQVMSRTLQRDIYSLGALGYPIKPIKQPGPDPLVALRYSCIYWVDHLYDWNSNYCANHDVDLQDGGVVDVFFQKRYLYWLEALSLCGSMSEGVVLVAKLESLLQVLLSPASIRKIC